MKRIAFISMANMYTVPYIRKYISAMGGCADYDIIMWNRHGLDEGDYGARRVFAYTKPMDEALPKGKKLVHMVGFCAYVGKILRKQNYDGVIVLHTNAAVLLAHILCTKYSGKFILDIRDYSLERNRLYLAIEKKLLAHCAQCFISSDGFRAFLPEHEYHLVHNNAEISADTVNAYRNRKRTDGVIRITFVGMVRFYPEGKALAQSIGDDPRFLVGYYGKNGKKMEAFIGLTSNHEYADQFPPERTMDYYMKTDAINNIYGNGIYVDHLLSNKLYYSAQLGIPILVSPNTYMEQIVQKYGLGFVYDVNDPEAPQRFYQYYQSLDWDKFYENCDTFCREVAKDDAVFEKLVRKFAAQENGE